MKMTFVENALPIDCLASSGSLIGILHRLCLPNLTVNIIDEERKISPVVKPSRLDEVEHIECVFLQKKCQYCLYHTYDTYLRLFFYEATDSSGLLESSTLYNDSISIEINIDKKDFIKYFENVGLLPLPPSPHSVFIQYCNHIKNEAKDFDVTMNSLLKVISDQSQSQETIMSYQSKRGEDGNIRPELKAAISSVSRGVEEILIKVGCKSLSDLTGRIGCFSRISQDLLNVVSFVVVDHKDKKKLIIYSRIEFLEADGESSAVQTTPTEHEMTYEIILESYMIDFCVAQWDEKCVVMKYIIDGFMVSQSSEVTMDDNNYNYSLSINEPEVWLQTTFSPFQDKKSVVTMTVYRIAGVPIGLSVVKGDPFTKFLPVCFLIIHPRKL